MTSKECCTPHLLLALLVLVLLDVPEDLVMWCAVEKVLLYPLLYDDPFQKHLRRMATFCTVSTKPSSIGAEKIIVESINVENIGSSPTHK